MIKASMSAILLFILATNASAYGWVPEDCPGPPPKEWAAYEKEVRTAIPSSTVYVPKPFPVTEAEIITDLKHQYFRIWKSTKRAKIPKEELPLLDGLETGALRFHVEKVVDWTPLRCHPKYPSPFYYFVRVFNPREGELARFLVEKSGLLAQWANVPEDANLKARWLEALPAIPANLAEIKAKYGIQGTDAQYVTTVAGTTRCPRTRPCVAFKARGKMYLFDRTERDGLFEFTPQSPGVTSEEMRERARGGAGATARGVDTRVMGLFSVGNRWV
ncbi:MAG TPA: hypothetical protein VF789_32360 [Thermoanaerobaculia bacterium]